MLFSSVIVSVSALAQYRVVGYYPMWEQTSMPASAINFNVLTHINHAFAWPNTDGSISSDADVVDTALINTTHRAGRKILLSFGGAGTTQTENFATVTADSALRKTFINNIVTQLAASHYDGADLDWEGPSNLAQRANEVVFVQELRSAFRAVDTTWLITMAIGASDYSGQWRDFTTLTLYVDWFNAMEYDFHGSWSSVAGHNAPLNIGSDPNTDPDAYSIVESIQYLAGTRAIPRNKLVLGLPFYGKLFGTSTIYTSYTGEEDLPYWDVIRTDSARPVDIRVGQRIGCTVLYIDEPGRAYHTRRFCIHCAQVSVCQDSRIVRSDDMGDHPGPDRSDSIAHGCYRSSNGTDWCRS